MSITELSGSELSWFMTCLSASGGLTRGFAFSKYCITRQVLFPPFTLRWPGAHLPAFENRSSHLPSFLVSPFSLSTPQLVPTFLSQAASDMSGAFSTLYQCWLTSLLGGERVFRLTFIEWLYALANDPQSSILRDPNLKVLFICCGHPH